MSTMTDLRGRLALAAKLADDPTLLSEYDRIAAVQFELFGDRVKVWTDPERAHEVKFGKDGVLYCDCPDWRFRAKRKAGVCKHVLRLQVEGVEIPKREVWP